MCMSPLPGWYMRFLTNCRILAHMYARLQFLFFKRKQVRPLPNFSFSNCAFLSLARRFQFRCVPYDNPFSLRAISLHFAMLALISILNIRMKVGYLPQQRFSCYHILAQGPNFLLSLSRWNWTNTVTLSFRASHAMIWIHSAAVCMNIDLCLGNFYFVSFCINVFHAGERDFSFIQVDNDATAKAKLRKWSRLRMKPFIGLKRRNR